MAKKTGAKTYILRNLPDGWNKFVAKCVLDGTTAAEELRRFISQEAEKITIGK